MTERRPRYMILDVQVPIAIGNGIATVAYGEVLESEPLGP